MRLSMFNSENHCLPTRSRREFIQDAFCGVGSIALAGILQQQLLRADDGVINPLAPKSAHRSPKAKSVIFLFMSGGPSHLETFDPKPLLNTLHGQTRPKDFGEAKYQFISPTAKLFGTKRTFRK